MYYHNNNYIILIILIFGAFVYIKMYTGNGN